MFKNLKKKTMIFLIMLNQLTCEITAFGRAGGGGGHGGGGHSGGSHGSGGHYGGSGNSTFDKIENLIWIILIAWLISIAIRSRLISEKFCTWKINKYQKEDFDIILRKANLENDDALLDRVENIYYKIQRAWTKRSIEKARGYISKSLYDDYEDRLQSMIDKGRRNVLTSIKFYNAYAVSACHNRHGKLSLKMRISGSMYDYIIDEKHDGKVIRGRKDRPESFSETWTFTIENNKLVLDKIKSK